MSTKILVQCDGPKCRRQRDSSIHSNTWFKITYKIGQGGEKIIDVCSLYCMINWANNETELTGITKLIEEGIEKPPKPPLSHMP